MINNHNGKDNKKRSRNQIKTNRVGLEELKGISLTMHKTIENRISFLSRLVLLHMFQLKTIPHDIVMCPHFSLHSDPISKKKKTCKLIRLIRPINTRRDVSFIPSFHCFCCPLLRSSSGQLMIARVQWDRGGGRVD